MTEHVGTAPAAPGEGDRTAADLVDTLLQFDGPAEQFLDALLALQCRVGAAEGGVILRPIADDNIDVLALFPRPEPNSQPLAWLKAAVECSQAVMRTGRTAVGALHAPDDLYGGPPRYHVIVTALRTAGPAALAGFLVREEDAAAVAARRDQLEATAALLSVYELQQGLRSRQADFGRIRAALDILPPVNEHDRFMAAAMAFCNEAAARWGCGRVCLGFLKGRYVQLRAMSHTEKFSRKMKLVQDLESAMEECLDQDLEVAYPAEPDSTVITRAVGEVSKRHGPAAIVSLPLRKGGEVVAVLILERPAEQPFAPDEIESMRLTCDLVTPRLANLHEHDKWFGARAAGAVRKGLAALAGPKHTWKKLIAALVAALVLFLIFAKGDYTAEAPFTLEATERRIITAPFDSFIEDVFVERGDDAKVVGEDDDPEARDKKRLAILQTSELEYQLAAAQADLAMYNTEADAAMTEDKRAEAQIARAKARGVAAQIARLKHHIEKATIWSPVPGRVIAGDLKKQIGAAVKTGDVLFEIAPLDALHAELEVPEALIADVKVGQPGELATEDHASIKFAFTVERIDPIAEVIDQRNVFRVRVTLSGTTNWMMPKMKGVAKIKIGRERLAWIWTRRLINWVRMKLWI